MLVPLVFHFLIEHTKIDTKMNLCRLYSNCNKEHLTVGQNKVPLLITEKMSESFNKFSPKKSDISRPAVSATILFENRLIEFKSSWWSTDRHNTKRRQSCPKVKKMFRIKVRTDKVEKVWKVLPPGMMMFMFMLEFWSLFELTVFWFWKIINCWNFIL